MIIGAASLYVNLVAPDDVQEVATATASPSIPAQSLPLPAPAPAVASNVYIELLDPTYSLGAEPVRFAQSAPASAGFEYASAMLDAPIAEAPATVAEHDPVPLQQVAKLDPNVESSSVEPSIPAPAPRPQELAVPAGEPPLPAPAHTSPPRSKAALLASPAPDRRSFFEKLFGASQSTGPALAYAAPEDGVVNPARRLVSAPPASADQKTAIYDITAHVVYMPDGTKLEAHSGLGSRLDDPRYVNERMHGPTPPHVYELTPREALFHGVQALRLNPVGGEGSIYGRSGLLAHTYMLGPNGDSNGCVSFKNYNAFLQAYMRGEVKRLLVVARL